jgi:uncharacterized membrane protein (DUF4010 family)
MEHIDLIYRFGAALAIGILIGLQREYAYGGVGEELFAGIRTFALISLAGCGGGLVANELGSAWGFVVVFAVVGALVVVAHFVGAWHKRTVGLTTEMAALLTVMAGALCYWNYLALAAALAVATTVLLSLKLEMHTFAQRISREDLYATLKFAVITAIVLPVLPNQTYGWPPLDVLNPYEIWLMVVLISGISFLGYVLIKLVGPRHGIGLTGILGGLISSTPVTLSFAQRSQQEHGLAKSFAQAITVAWAITYLRVLVEIAALNRDLLGELWLPMGISAAVGLVYAGYLYFVQRPPEQEGEVSFSNPFELGTALKFGLLYAGVLLISKAAQVYLGDVGVYVSSAIVGLPDADAITLSMARLSRESGGLDLGTAARAVVLGVASNTAAKGGIVLATGSGRLRRALLPAMGLMLLSGLGVAFLL